MQRASIGQARGLGVESVRDWMMRGAVVRQLAQLLDDNDVMVLKESGLYTLLLPVNVLHLWRVNR